MALAIDASTPAEASITGGSPVTTASFTPPAGALLVCLYGANDPSGAVDTSVTAMTNPTGTAITFTRQVRKNLNASSLGGAGQEGGAEIWTGVAPGGAITVRAAGPGTTNYDKWLKVVVVTGADTSALTNVAAASANSGAPSVTVSSCLAGSHVFAIVTDWSQAGIPATLGSGQTLIDDYNRAGQISMHAWRTTSVLAASGSQTMNITSPSTQDYNLVAIEVRDASPPASSASSPLVHPARRLLPILAR